MILITCGLLIAACKSEPPDLVGISKKIESITVYDLEGLSGTKYSKNELENAFQATIEAEHFRLLAPQARYKNEWVLWKGSRLAVARVRDGKESLLALSYYGGFFKILGYDGYFYFEAESRKKWDELFSKGIVQENFIPKRIERNRHLEAEKP